MTPQNALLVLASALLAELELIRWDDRPSMVAIAVDPLEYPDAVRAMDGLDSPGRVRLVQGLAVRLLFIHEVYGVIDELGTAGANVAPILFAVDEGDPTPPEQCFYIVALGHVSDVGGFPWPDAPPAPCERHGNLPTRRLWCTCCDAEMQVCPRCDSESERWPLCGACAPRCDPVMSHRCRARREEV